MHYQNEGPNVGANPVSLEKVRENKRITSFYVDVGHKQKKKMRGAMQFLFFSTTPKPFLDHCPSSPKLPIRNSVNHGRSKLLFYGSV